MSKRGWRYSKYNGHKNWRYWNVALWIGNDEGLYNLGREVVRVARTKYRGRKMYDVAARIFIASQIVTLVDNGRETEEARTPDGALYTIAAVSAALSGLEL